MTIQVITDSVAGLPKEEIQEKDIAVISIQIFAEGETYLDSDLELDSFYRTYLADSKNLPTSSLPSHEMILEVLEKAAAEKRDVVGIFVSGKLSGTIEAIRLTAQIVAEKYPGWRYAIVDAESPCMQEGFIVRAAANCALEGGSLEQCEQAAKDMIPRTRFIFSPAVLDYLRAGGRIGNAATLLANILQIRPVLTVDDGEVQTLAKIRMVKRAMEFMENTFKTDIERCGLANLVVHYIGDNKELAIKWAKECIEPIAKRVVEVLPVSPVVGVHVGPALGVTYETIDVL